MAEKKRRPGGGIAADGTTYIVEVPFDHPDTDRLYLAKGMTAEEIRRYRPNLWTPRSRVNKR